MEKEKLSEILEQINTKVKRLYYIATHDEKTGLHNHIFFKEVFGFELEEAKRGKYLSLVIADVDFFKKLNDTYGHLTADKILKRIAEVLEKSLRKYDIVARFGGEEFFIMLPNTNIEKAKKVSERMRKNILNDKILSKYKVTISLGVSEYKEKDSFSRISIRADKALYKAKKSGRNRVCC